MRTHTLLTNHFTRLRTVMASLVAVALLGINVAPRRVAATAVDNTITLQTTTALPLTGTFQTVNNLPGDQTDIHIDCDLASYTDDNFVEGYKGIRYFDFGTNTDRAISGNGIYSQPDVSGHHISFTESTASGAHLVIFDTVSQTRTVIPGVGNSRAALGGNLLAFEQRTTDDDFSLIEAEIGVYALNTGIVTSLTDDNLFDSNPSVSPTGNAVVWSKCQVDRSNCDIYSAIQAAPGIFATHALTDTQSAAPFGTDTDGQIAVYVSTREGDTDIYYQPVAGGLETRLSIAGEQRWPNISGNLISFESETIPGWDFDLFVYDLTTTKLYRITNTPNSAETLNDISVCNGIARVVYAAPAADYDVFAFTFPVPSSVENQINDLMELVQGLNLPRGTENSLITKLQDALSAMNASDTATACSFISAFINECDAQSGKKLTAAQATQLINSGKQIKTDLNCL